MSAFTDGTIGSPDVHAKFYKYLEMFRKANDSGVGGKIARQGMVMVMVRNAHLISMEMEVAIVIKLDSGEKMSLLHAYISSLT